MATEAQANARRRYQREGTDGFAIRYSKRYDYPSKLRRAGAMHGKGPTEYIKWAVDEALRRDGIEPHKPTTADNDE